MHILILVSAPPLLQPATSPCRLTHLPHHGVVAQEGVQVGSQIRVAKVDPAVHYTHRAARTQGRAWGCQHVGQGRAYGCQHVRGAG